MSDKDSINLSEWYTAQEAAAEMDTTPKYVRTIALQYGKIKTFKLHDHVMLYWKKDVRAYGKVQKGRKGRPKNAEYAA